MPSDDVRSISLSGRIILPSVLLIIDDALTTTSSSKRVEIEYSIESGVEVSCEHTKGAVVHKNAHINIFLSM